MFVYRIVKTIARTTDLSGTGAFKTGGRWNSKGTYMLYTSQNSSLAFLETLVHFDESNYPPNLFIVKINVTESAPLFSVPENTYPAQWMQLELLENKALGDQWMSERKFLGVKIKSAINDFEFNYLLNPLFPAFHDLVRIVDVSPIKLDERLVN